MRKRQIKLQNEEEGFQKDDKIKSSNLIFKSRVVCVVKLILQIDFIYFISDAFNLVISNHLNLFQMKSARKFQIAKIPNELCQKIIDCEFQIDSGNFNEQMVVKTTELYSEAVNFFLANSDYNEDNLKKAHFYQDKIKKLLGREDVRQILEGERINPRVSDLQRQLQKAKQSAPHQAKRLLQFYKNQSTSQQVLIKKTVEQQNQKLEQRLSIRSKSKSKLTMSSPKLTTLLRKQE